MGARPARPAPAQAVVPRPSAIPEIPFIPNGPWLTFPAPAGATGSSKYRQEIPVLDLPLPDPPPAGWEWIAAYRQWARW